MNINEIADEISKMNDTEIGGDSALDGFEFQLSSAIFLMFEKMKEDIPFVLLYEKIEDFIIIDEKINLYQAKGINSSITPNCLVQNRSKSSDQKNSIIEKMYDNYLEIQNKFSEFSVETTLITCSTKEFSYKLWGSKKDSPELLKEMKKLCFQDIGAQQKNEIISQTRHTSYDWLNINARRLIPKMHHEEVTRTFIEDVVTEKCGPNKINSRALYASILLKIKSIRKNKEGLTNDFLYREFNNYLTIDSEKEYVSVLPLLDTTDQHNLAIQRSYNIYKNIYTIEHVPTHRDYNLIKDLYNSKDYLSINSFYEDISSDYRCKDIILRLKEYEIKALILLVI